MMFSVDKTRREAWMPVWPDRVVEILTPRNTEVAAEFGLYVEIFSSLRAALTHFHMPRAALVAP